jgi:soluble lytic murein transglycosylase-like protein
MTTEELIALAKQTAVAHQLDPVLVCSVCEQESACNPFAIRYEPAFYNRYIVPLNLKNATDAQARAFSWGLMQTMGQVAIENGVVVKYLSELCDPYVGLNAGCVILKKKLFRAGGNVEHGLLAWNGGGAPEYPAEVIARMGKYA